ncbi:unnamed protein product [Gadus morhua 'NCC']
MQEEGDVIYEAVETIIKLSGIQCPLNHYWVCHLRRTKLISREAALARAGLIIYCGIVLTLAQDQSLAHEYEKEEDMLPAPLKAGPKRIPNGCHPTIDLGVVILIPVYL